MYVSPLIRTEESGEWEGKRLWDYYNQMELQIEVVEYELG
jgi:hypothetical protein